ncbi:hypothetical protein BD289DRAFT_275337 [Coniella lustricola]|uniref:Secreted protein n=1 Tax=Coniella lustricola TaxID=2025994 RepID=A0A2T3A6R0_9PEZI|nr:hypothetical protein BD289DRAFT_275337 [Coniella lustricola]
MFSLLASPCLFSLFYLASTTQRLIHPVTSLTPFYVQVPFLPSTKCSGTTSTQQRLFLTSSHGTLSYFVPANQPEFPSAMDAIF